MNGEEEVTQPVNDNKPIITVKREGSTSNEWRVECRIPMRLIAKPSLPSSSVADFSKFWDLMCVMAGWIYVHM
jgi:hypothetical protein